MAASAADSKSVVDLIAQGLRRRANQIGILALALLAVAPLLMSDIMMLKFTGAMLFAVFTISWDFVSGYTGYISFGHAVFFGAAGYTSGILNSVLGLDPLVTIPIGVLAAVVVGLLIGIPALRLEGPYLSLITLIAPLILLQVFIYYRGITGGQRGLFGVENLSFDPLVNYYIGFAVLVVSLAVALAFTRSNLGSIMTAISEDEDLVAAAGLNPAKYKIFAFVMSGAIGGFAGAVLPHTAVGSVTPSLLLALLVSAYVIIAAILGGMGTITGAAVGGFGFWVARDYLRNVEATVPLLDVPFHDIYLILLFFLTMAVIFFLPDGLVPWAGRKLRHLELRARGKEPEPVPDGGTTPLERALDRYDEALRTLGGGDDDER